MSEVTKEASGRKPVRVWLLDNPERYVHGDPTGFWDAHETKDDEVPATQYVREDVVEGLLGAARKALGEIEYLLGELPERDIERVGPTTAQIHGNLRAAIAKAEPDA